jgi:hypothetical protein
MLIPVKRKAPAYWASALINRDASSLTPDEAKQAFACEREQGFGDATSVEDVTCDEQPHGTLTEVCITFLVQVPIDEIVVPAYLDAAMDLPSGAMDDETHWIWEEAFQAIDRLSV